MTLDRDKWAELYDSHAGDLHRYLAIRVDPQVAADLVAEAFLTAWERRDTFDPALASWKAWLYGIATNLLRRHARSEDRRLRAWARDHGRRVSVDHVDDRATSAVDARSAVEDLASTLVGLRPEERDVLLMVAWADLSAAEIAEVTGTPINTVRTRLFRARTKLRARLKGDSDA